MTVTSNIRPFEDGNALGRSLAAEIAERIGTSFASGERFFLGCPGGRTPKTTYAALAAEVARRDFNLAGLVIVMMDDYVERVGETWQHVPSDAHNSCRRFAHEEIQGVLNAVVDPANALPDSNVWFPNPEHPAEYDQRIQDAGGIDFFILASGAGDGHIAFNPPGSTEDSRTRIVELAEQTRRDNLATFPDFETLDAVPTHGVTVGIATIAEQTAAAMILIGEDKRDAYVRLTSGYGYDPSWPSTIYRLMAEAALYADEAAVGAKGA